MKVFRVEKNQVGPYVGEGSPFCIELGLWDIGKRHPDPRDDIGGIVSKKHIYGFQTIDALHHWFHFDARQTLSGLGYKLSTYEVPEEDVKTGTFQVAFLRDRAEKTSEQSLI